MFASIQLHFIFLISEVSQPWDDISWDIISWDILDIPGQRQQLVQVQLNYCDLSFLRLVLPKASSIVLSLCYVLNMKSPLHTHVFQILLSQ